MHEVDFPKTLEQLRAEQKKRDEQLPPGSAAPELTTLPAAYSERVKRSEEDERSVGEILARSSQLIARPQKELVQAMEYADARRIVWAICQEKSAIIGREFQVDEANRGVIQNMIKYFTLDPECEWDLRKGLFLFGDVGRGKTYLMSVMQVFAAAARIEYRQFNWATCIDIVDEVLAQGEVAMQKYFRTEKDICFDDLGQEPAQVQRYGNALGVMERILTKRYSSFVNGKCITHVTTNLVPAEIVTTYGSRLADRAQEMFNFVKLNGTSRR